MRKFLFAACLSLGLIGMVSGGLRAAPPADEARPFVLNGVVAQVDADRERVMMAGNDGHRWTLDTSGADITLPDGNRAGATSDLTPGMRVHVSGRQLSVGIAEVETLRVLNTDSNPRSKPVPAPAAKAPVVKAPSGAAGEDIELRGTVDSVLTRLGAFVVRIQTHTRTIYLADDTDLSGMAQGDSTRFPVKLGDRVTVSGRLQPDGGVLADVVSLSRTIPQSDSGIHPERVSNQVLFGRISSTSNRYTGRDFKIHLTDDREIKVKVRRGLPIRQDGRSVSVHDLHVGDDVRVTGIFDGDDFKAEHINVLDRGESDSPDAPSPPVLGRRGL